MYAGICCINISVRKRAPDKLDGIKNAAIEVTNLKCAISENRSGKMPDSLIVMLYRNERTSCKFRVFYLTVLHDDTKETYFHSLNGNDRAMDHFNVIPIGFQNIILAEFAIAKDAAVKICIRQSGRVECAGIKLIAHKPC